MHVNCTTSNTFEINGSYSLVSKPNSLTYFTTKLFRVNWIRADKMNVRVGDLWGSPDNHNKRWGGVNFIENICIDNPKIMASTEAEAYNVS